MPKEKSFVRKNLEVFWKDFEVCVYHRWGQINKKRATYCLGGRMIFVMMVKNMPKFFLEKLS